MDAISKQNLYLLGAFCAFGLVLCQTDVHLNCLPEKWVSGKNVTLQCSLLKSSYPSKCKTSTTNSVIFRRKIGQGAFDDECTLSDILGVCTSSGNCSCDKTLNATYYNFEYTFKANDDSEGYWDCSVPCFDGLTPLTSSAYDCDNRKVIVDPCLGYICGHDTQEKMAGCPCKCGTWWCDDECKEFCWWVFLLIGIAIVLVAFGSGFIIYKCCNTENLEPRAFARRFCSNLIQRVIAGAIFMFIVSAFNSCVRSLDCKRTDNTVRTNEEEKRQDSHEETSEHQNGQI